MTIILFNTFNSTFKKIVFAAKSLGATKENIFFDIVLKNSKKGILSAIIPDYAIEEAIKYLFITKSYRFSL